MRHSRRQFIGNGVAAAAGLSAAPWLGATGVAAQAGWPGDRPIRIIVPNSPGGPTDIISRIMQPQLQDSLGGTWIVENKGGGGGNIGIGQVARGEPDGTQFLVASSVIAVNPALSGDKPPYDPLNDFTYVAELAVTPNIYTIDAKLGIKTMKDFVVAAKAEPGKFNVSVPPVTTTASLGIELLKLIEGLKVGVVVHTGGGQALQTLFSGAVQVSAGALAPAKPHIDAGTLTPLAIMGDKRWHELPDVPTMMELGYKDYNLDTFIGLFAPPKTPAEIVARTHKSVAAAFAKPDVRATLEKNAFEVTMKGPDGLKARMEREVPMFKDIVSRAGIKLNEKG